MEYGLYGNPNNIIKIPVSIKIYYFVPDYNSLIQEFWWQTLDIPPYYYRIHKFLNYWKTNIEATIKDIEISSNYKPLQITITDYLLNIKN